MIYKHVHTTYFTGFKSDTISISDPSIDSDEGFDRLDEIPVKPGKWQVFKIIDKDKDIVVVKLVHEDYIKDDYDRTFIGNVDVECGAIGLFDNKPIYSESDWQDISDYTFEADDDHFVVAKPNNPFKCNGIVINSGFGDGQYRVYGSSENWKWIQLDIICDESYNYDDKSNR